VSGPDGSPHVFEVAPDGSAWPDGELAATTFGAAGDRRIALVWGQADGSVNWRISEGADWRQGDPIGPAAPAAGHHPDEGNPPETIVSIVSRSPTKLDVFRSTPVMAV
jgi:hypothetical protein